MSGTEQPELGSSGSSEGIEELPALERVRRVLDRAAPIDALGQLRRRVEKGRPSGLTASSTTAFSFDTNAIFRLGLGQGGADALDYLRTQHHGPIIVPGQTLQELWNNQLAAISPQAGVLMKKFEELRSEMEKIGEQLGDAGERARAALEDLLASHGHLLDPTSQEALVGTLEVLGEVGTVSYVPRRLFAGIASIRHETKTPPGFRDPGHGDFYVWADFLFGVAQLPVDSFDAVVLVTNDTKPDWSRKGVPHPILVAELKSLADVPFRLWSVADFHRHAREPQES